MNPYGSTHPGEVRYIMCSEKTGKEKEWFLDNADFKYYLKYKGEGYSYFTNLYDFTREVIWGERLCRVIGDLGTLTLVK